LKAGKAPLPLNYGFSNKFRTQEFHLGSNKFFHLFYVIEFIIAHLFGLNSFSNQENFCLFIFAEAKIGEAKSIPRCFAVICCYDNGYFILLFQEYNLSVMIRQVICTADDNIELVAMKLFLKCFSGNGVVFFKPRMSGHL